MAKALLVEHGIVCRKAGERLGYFGWPTVVRLDDGTLVVVSSGLRSAHVCPWGKTVLNVSTDDGQSWSEPRVINDSALDDRDAGVVNLGGGRLLTTWFTSDTRQYLHDDGIRRWLGDAEVESWRTTLEQVTDEIAAQGLGSWAMHSADAGRSWDAPIRVPVSSPHGPVRLRDGALCYLGKSYGSWQEMADGAILAAGSDDDRHSWRVLGAVPQYPGTVGGNYHEPHLVELPSGKLIGAIRFEQRDGGEAEQDAGITPFSMLLTESCDGGRQWSMPVPFQFHGSPPHLLRHSTGILVLTYGYRLSPFGQRAAFSYDEGGTWEHDWIIRDDGADGDLGYPSTVELSDGSLFSVYYQKAPGDQKCSLLWSRWQLPEKELT